MIVSFENVNFKYVTTPILDNVSFIINEKEKWGIVGINGSGKSTLLKILASKEKADSGNITYSKNLNISYCPQTDNFDDDLSIFDTVLLNTRGKNVDDYQIKSILNKLKLFDHNQKVGMLSGGQRKRLSLAIALILPADFYLLDEPTNHLDQDMILWLEQFLINLNKAIIMVTHDRYFLSKITNHMMEIDSGKIYTYEGNYADYLEQRELRYQQEMIKERKRQNFLRTEIEWIRRGAQARSTKAKDRIARFEAIASISAPVEREKLELQSATSRLGNKTIEINHISKSYNDIILFEDFSDNITKNDRIGIIGNNGCGKTTLLKTILGHIIPDSGSVEIGTTVKVGYFSQDNDIMNPDIRIIDYIKQFGEIVETADGDKITASQMLEKFLFIKDQQYTPISRCSGGEKRRLYLCSVLMQAPNILVFDEPTNDLDTDTLTILEDYLETFKGAVITVSHDRYFLDKICNRLWIFENGKVNNYIIDYSTYIENYVIKPQQSVKTTEKKEKGEFISKDKVYFSTKERKELEKLTTEIEQLESKISDLEKLLETLTDYQEIAKVSDELANVKDDYDSKSLRWLELSDKFEEYQSSK